MTASDNYSPPVADAADTAGADARAEMKKWWYYVIFTASGFAALIYEALWARYLKIFLGHAAYAQALVLVIFLLGIAAGSVIAARHSHRIRYPMVAYAVVEAFLALAAVYFHDVFILAQAWALDGVLPTLDSAASAEIFKWVLGASLILLQAVLLGATFPLLAAAMVRRWPRYPGNIISALYFSNSAGAAAGVLVGGFVLVPSLGLVGAGLIGGAINAAIAVVVWMLSRRFGEVPVAPPPEAPVKETSKLSVAPAILLWTAAITGMSSFIYEIIWTRLISLLLGASVYSFEIMLAVFISGLAIGSWLVRRRIEQVAEPVVLLAKVQIAMGVFAMISLVAYPFSFDLYASYWRDLTGGGLDAHIYHWLFGGLITAAMMMPVAICAGMTLPLITRRLMTERGESSLGSVYAANTLGAIVGVWLAVHWLLPEAGAQYAMIVGGLADLFLGCVLFAYLRRHSLAAAGAAATVAATAAAVVFGSIPLHYAAAGIYRHGIKLRDNQSIVFYRDGKTASIAVYKTVKDNYTNLTIATNGKPDASLRYGEGRYTSDEMTMTIAGLLGLLARPDARYAANIGFGSGLTSMSLLQSPVLERLDNIEIEPMMVAGARRLGEKAAPVFADERNHFIYDDAKSVFARVGRRYDIIISEPSNPWISGIGGLFTREFYQRVDKVLADDGIFIQWLPFYESSPQIFSSVVAALNEEFGDFRMYLSGDADAVLIAARDSVPAFRDDIFSTPEAREFFGGYDYVSAADMDALFIGDKRHLTPYFSLFGAPVNSDYFPYIEHEAPRAFFRRSFYSWPQAQLLAVPFMEIAGVRPPPSEVSLPKFHRSSIASAAGKVYEQLDGIDNADSDIRQRMTVLQKNACGMDSFPATQSYMISLSDFTARLMPHAPRGRMMRAWEILEESPCITALLEESAGASAALYTRFWRALSLRDAEMIAATAEQLLAFASNAPAEESTQILLLAAMAANYRLGEYDKVGRLSPRVLRSHPPIFHAAGFIGALALEKI